ncbi:peptidoglycan editing factor PgeF [Bisgaard Taxon 45]
MDVIKPNWSAPQHVRAFSTLTSGGYSLPPYASLNLGDHVGDDPNTVKRNRTLLVEALKLPQFPLFLNQIHSTRVLSLPTTGQNRDADAVYTHQANQVCLVMTADCLPVLLTHSEGNEVAAVHAGWRGLCHGILERTVEKFQAPTDQLMAWLGPAISQPYFQVGKEVREQFIAQDPDAACAFLPDPVVAEKYLADLYLLATQRLNKLGITQVSGGDYCTFAQKEQFFSYRREQQTGRMATLIWFE